MNNNEQISKAGIEAHEKLTAALKSIEYEKKFPPSGKHIKLWNVKTGEHADEFGFSELTGGCVLVFVDKSENNLIHFHTELIAEKYFHDLLDLWPAYLNGSVPLGKIKPVKNAKYLVSIMHYLFETDKDLKPCREIDFQ